MANIFLLKNYSTHGIILRVVVSGQTIAVDQIKCPYRQKDENTHKQVRTNIGTGIGIGVGVVMSWDGWNMNVQQACCISQYKWFRSLKYLQS